MRVDLSFEKFATVLAAAGASTAIACAGATPPPVQANEVKPPSSAVAGHASCSAGSCGGEAKDAKSNGVAAAPAAFTPPVVADAPAPAPASIAPAAVATATLTSGTRPAPQPKAATKASSAPKRAAPAEEASCGAGTCSGDTKKKIL